MSILRKTYPVEFDLPSGRSVTIQVRRSRLSAWRMKRYLRKDRPVPIGHAVKVPEIEGGVGRWWQRKAGR